VTVASVFQGLEPEHNVLSIIITARCTKRSSLEPKLLRSVYRNSRTAYRLVTNLVNRVNFALVFRGAQIFNIEYLALCVGAQRKLATLGVWNSFPEFHELWPGLQFNCNPGQSS